MQPLLPLRNAVRPALTGSRALGLENPLLSSSSVRQPSQSPPLSPSAAAANLPSSRRTMACRSTSPSSSSAVEKIPSTSIRVLRSVEAVRRWRRPHTLDRRTVGFVPTMGALHEGHVSLIRAAARENHHVVVSVYVNPAQFGIAEDLGSYPVTWAADSAVLARLDRELADDGAGFLAAGVSAVFAPSTADMYPAGFPGQAPDSPGSFVTLTPISSVLEGASRPTFFRGVATVCMKLFNIVQPDRVYFGQKDVQQTVVIRAMVRDFMLPTAVVIGPTVRAPDGLAQSSRNVYLGARRRAVAPVLHDALRAAETAYSAGAGARDRDAILDAARSLADAVLADQMALAPAQRVRFEIDYLSLSDPETMQELAQVDPARGAILSGAIRMLPVEDPQPDEDRGHSDGPLVRLIDNIIIQPADTAAA